MVIVIQVIYVVYTTHPSLCVCTRVCMCVHFVCMCVCVCTATLLSHSNTSYESSISLSGPGYLTSTLTDTVKQLCCPIWPTGFLVRTQPKSPRTERVWETVRTRTLGPCTHPVNVKLWDGGLWSRSSGSACGVFLSVHAWEPIARCSLYSSVFGNPPAAPLK